MRNVVFSSKRRDSFDVIHFKFVLVRLLTLLCCSATAFGKRRWWWEEACSHASWTLYVWGRLEFEGSSCAALIVLVSLVGCMQKAALLAAGRIQEAASGPLATLDCSVCLTRPIQVRSHLRPA